MATTENGITRYTFKDLTTYARLDIERLICGEFRCNHRLVLKDVELAVGNGPLALTYKGLCTKHNYTVYRNMAI